MKELFFSSLSENIGLTLLHSLWQGLIGVVLIIVVNRIVAAKYSTLRYWLFISIMLMVFLTNLLTLSNQILGTNSSQEIQTAAGLTARLGMMQLKDAIASLTTVSSHWLSNILLAMPYFVMLWWIGMVALFIRMLFNLWHVRRLTTLNHVPISSTVQTLLDHLIQRLKINKVVKIAQSPQISVPSVIGHLKPVILLPIGLVSGLSNQQVEAILLHELSHIKRHDFLLNIIQSVVEVIYFFNPFMWIISRAIRDEREHASDDVAISLGISASVYAETLAGVFKYAIKRQQFAVSFASKNKLTLKRIQRIMKNQSNNNNKLMASMIFVFAITLSMYYGAQSHAPGQEVAVMLPNSTIMASVIPTFSTPGATKPDPIDKGIIEQKEVIVADTTDPKELKKRKEEYERAMGNLKSTKEWQEAEKLREEMVAEHMKYLKDISPAIEEAMRLAEESMTLSEEQLMLMEEKLDRVTDEMADLQITEELERVMEINAKVIEETMSQMQEQLADMNFEEIEEMAQFYAHDAKKIAVEAETMAKDAKKMALEAEKHVEAIEEFLDELNADLIEDGYIKSSKDLDQLRFKNGDVYVNGEKVKAKDAKKYIKIRDKYFDDDDDFNMN